MARFARIIDALCVAVNTPIDFEVAEVSFHYSSSCARNTGSGCGGALASASASYR